MYVTLDLDDTLIRTQKDYDRAIEEFSNWLAEQTTATSVEIAERINQIDRENLEEFGLDKKRFPATFEDAVSEYLDAPTESDYDCAREVACSAYRSESEYAARGFREGAKELLEKLEKPEVTKHLITAGDSEIQQRKIDALDLNYLVDEIAIVPLGGKEKTLRELKRTQASETVLHIGNSRSSDVETALVAGVPVIYIPDSEWRNTYNSTSDLIENPDVYVYNSIPAMLNDLNQILAKENENQSFALR